MLYQYQRVLVYQKVLTNLLLPKPICIALLLWRSARLAGSCYPSPPCPSPNPAVALQQPTAALAYATAALAYATAVLAYATAALGCTCLGYLRLDLA